MDNQQLEEKLTLLDHLQSSCTHCGICSEACATFQLSGWEQESPRGRLQLAAQFLHGHIPLHSSTLSTFDRCLGCQACEPLCPQKVPYRQVRQLVQELRRERPFSSSAAMERSQYKRWMTLAYRVGHQGWRRFGSHWLSLPSLDCQSQGSFARKHKRSIKGQATLAVCCVQDLYQHEVMEQALTFMQRLGYSLNIDQKQPCCGALFERLVHGGEETICYVQEQQQASTLQHKTLKAFLKWMPSQTYFLAKGCQCFVAKHHPHVIDLYTWIEEILDQQQLTLSFSQPQVVYYQPYCASEKGKQDPIERLLHQIENLTIRDIPYPEACCGGYCGEALLHPQNAQSLVLHKLSSLPDKATLVVTSPDCWGSFKNYQTKLEFQLLYPIQLLNQACIKKREKIKGNSGVRSQESE